jgi:hypothetical protein
MLMPFGVLHLRQHSMGVNREQRREHDLGPGRDRDQQQQRNGFPGHDASSDWHIANTPDVIPVTAWSDFAKPKVLCHQIFQSFP